MAMTVEQLAARVEFLEAWVQVPAQYLPGYVAPVAVEQPVDAAPVETPVASE